VQETPAKAGLLVKLRKALQWDVTPRMAKFALAAQFAAVLALAVMIGSPDNTETQDLGNSQYETVGLPGVAADLLIGFAPGTTEAQIRELLMRMDAQITAGPNSIGIYSITLPAGVDSVETQNKLEQNSTIIYVQPAVAP
jgi:hypothetical protein